MYSAKIRRLRREYKLSCSDMSKLIGVPVNTIKNIESGTYIRIRKSTISKLNSFFNSDIDLVLNSYLDNRKQHLV